MGMVQDVEKALRATGDEPRDAATRALALHYAAEIDSGAADLADHGPKLLAALDALLLTPRARAAATKRAPGREGSGRNPLDELRAARERRATAMDATAT